MWWCDGGGSGSGLLCGLSELCDEDVLLLDLLEGSLDGALVFNLVVLHLADLCLEFCELLGLHGLDRLGKLFELLELLERPAEGRVLLLELRVLLCEPLELRLDVVELVEQLLELVPLLCAAVQCLCLLGQRLLELCVLCLEFCDDLLCLARLLL